MNVLLCDDDQFILALLNKMLVDVNGVTIVGSASSGEECLKIFNETLPDLVFLDIEMADMSGLDVARSILYLKNDTKIVFATGHPEFAVEAFEISAVDYLVKPFTLERVLSVISKIRKQMAKPCITRPTLTIKSGSNIFIIDTHDILYVEKILKKSLIHTKDGLCIEIYDSLCGLQTKLPFCFMRTHQSFLVNVCHVYLLKPYNAVSYILEFQSSDKTATLLRAKYDEFLELLEETTGATNIGL